MRDDGGQNDNNNHIHNEQDACIGRIIDGEGFIGRNAARDGQHGDEKGRLRPQPYLSRPTDE